MSVRFEIPEWLIATDSAPPAASGIDPHRVEDLVNRFIAAKQEALFTAPDAYYRTTGADAVDGATAILDRLNELKSATLDAAGDDGTRLALGPRLAAHLDDASDGIDRHVAAQREVFNRRTLAERQRLIQRAAGLEPDNHDKLAGLAEAHAGAARELARMNGEPEAAAMDAARSAIWRIAERSATGATPPQDRAAGSGSPNSREGDRPYKFADDLKNYCIGRCSDLILMQPFSKRPATFDQCMAHCEGLAYFHQIQPFIPFPGSGK
ncbi:MAG: hypothetical protein JSS04_11860 [Proteobacteria bacterium]|nr:hypothetical protein [Pseudomonadota bacterium]